MKINEIITFNEGKNDPNIFKAIIAIGIPGSGKTTILKKITGHTGLKQVNIDELLELIQKKYNIQDIYHDENYSRYKEVYSKKVDNLIKGRLGLVIDGTNRDFTMLTKLKNRLEKIGYSTFGILFRVDVETATKRTKNRERKVDDNYVKQSFNDIAANEQKIIDSFDNLLTIDTNDIDAIDYKSIDKIVNKFLNEPLSNKAKSWLNEDALQEPIKPELKPFVYNKDDYNYTVAQSDWSKYTFIVTVKDTNNKTLTSFNVNVMNNYPSKINDKIRDWAKNNHIEEYQKELREYNKKKEERDIQVYNSLSDEEQAKIDAAEEERERLEQEELERQSEKERQEEGERESEEKEEAQRRYQEETAIYKKIHKEITDWLDKREFMFTYYEGKSNISVSSYITISIPETFNKFGKPKKSTYNNHIFDKAETVKVRISDHDSPPSYGDGDFEFGTRKNDESEVIGFSGDDPTILFNYLLKQYNKNKSKSLEIKESINNTFKVIKNEYDIRGVKTGKLTEFYYSHNKDSATELFGKPTPDSPYGRYYEPAGYYVVIISKEYMNHLPNHDYGKFTAKNPLVIPYDNMKWKTTLAEKYKSRGKKLSDKLKQKGYDAIITIDGNAFSETIIL